MCVSMDRGAVLYNNKWYTCNNNYSIKLGYLYGYKINNVDTNYNMKEERKIYVGAYGLLYNAPLNESIGRSLFNHKSIL